MDVPRRKGRTGSGLARGSEPSSPAATRLVDVIDEGGMGSVYLAEQTEPVKRQVAAQADQDGDGFSRDVLARFDAPSSRPSP